MEPLDTLKRRFETHTRRHSGMAWAQMLGEFDLKTSSWVLTPPEVHSQGGVPFCDRRYGQVFKYHNGVQSYYAARGFRGSIEV
jgi:Protein of unknown function (DUF4256)